MCIEIAFFPPLFFNYWNNIFLCSVFLLPLPISFLKGWLYLLFLLWRSHSRSSRITLRSPWRFFRRNGFKFILLNHWNKCEGLPSIQTTVVQLKIETVWQIISCILRNGELNLPHGAARPLGQEGAPFFADKWQN